MTSIGLMIKSRVFGNCVDRVIVERLIRVNRCSSVIADETHLCKANTFGLVKAISGTVLG